MKNLIYLFIFFTIGLGFTNCKSVKSTSASPSKTEISEPILPRFAFDFEESDQLMPLLDKAERENKLVFVDFYTDWCLPCRLMERDVFMDKELGIFFNKHFISYKVDAEKGNGINLARIFDVKAYPTLLFLDKKGQVLERKEGAAYHSELKAMAESAMTKQ